MPSLNPSGSSLKALLAKVPAETPILMLNLLRFNAQAQYPTGSGHSPCSGREAYGRYSVVAGQKVAEAGGNVRLQARALHALIAPEDEQWDQMLVVAYPSVQAFLNMLAQEDYKAATVHRTAALMDSRLVCTTEVK
ncbi:MAG TPA: DUF1330 domain-containing protein [Pseudomonas xinjiangensis]|uniref:DUF1330 domain-containing protein n=2 Tax=root TaxID=1 RepID=A0A7V1BSB2_9GAMM|nr:DUF1330 domain-containing protein [Halopseudomonas xinjiangensis]HEC46428.1 DUF1330 domain-containing protein [Halopseudomonas xinjiangensis]